MHAYIHTCKHKCTYTHIHIQEVREKEREIAQWSNTHLIKLWARVQIKPPLAPLERKKRLKSFCEKFCECTDKYSNADTREY
jgi:hypothetical protein